MSHRPSGVSFRRAAPADAEAYSHFSRRIAIETFAADNNPDDFRLYLDQTFSPERQDLEMQDPGTTVLLGEHEGRVAAYAYLRLHPAPEVVPGAKPMEVARFYVDTPWHGRGVAWELMGEVVRKAEEVGADTLWLGVWERNDRAQAFYHRCGFEDKGSHVFMVGRDAQTDRLFAAPVGLVASRLAKAAEGGGSRAGG